ncbi:isopenicillin N synthase family oxygenase [Rhodococcus sp. LW-XY12]|uniref:isopenicillin N synthase family dioxygenase n=1 Tax=Rhodococcus TaxID=1827 RepID=UPI001C598244|nr:2OG-Fe(II) oxygenase family protein [Rhodococcus sp. LW-XY12]QXU54567.1 hypothetical protein KXC42_04625 [Rhodococcus sp. LW-XY12]
MPRNVPIIDLKSFIDGTDKESVVAAVDDACRNTGFLVVTGHGVAPEIMQGALDAIRSFYEQPESTKAAHDNSVRGTGWKQFASMSLGNLEGDGTVPPDLREEFRVRRLDIIDWVSPIWGDPLINEAFRDALVRYYTTLDRLADVIGQIFALAVGKQQNYFEQFTDHHDSYLGLYYYPALEKAPEPGQLRGGAHTDFGSLTILYGYPSVQGLQVWNDEEWEDVPLVPDSFVINIGDLMQRWTNDVWSSTRHRVVNPSDGQWDQARFSMAFFHQPNYDALIESLDDTEPAKGPSPRSVDTGFVVRRPA